MTRNRRYKSEAFEAVHSAVEGMYRAGTIDKATMREFDDSCLSVPAKMEPKRIKRIRESQKVSQPVFAPLSEHERIDGGEVGEWREKAERHGAQASGYCGEARVEGACLSD
jgi:putative transcriptional regulator